MNHNSSKTIFTITVFISLIISIFYIYYITNYKKSNTFFTQSHKVYVEVIEEMEKQTKNQKQLKLLNYSDKDINDLYKKYNHTQINNLIKLKFSAGQYHNYSMYQSFNINFLKQYINIQKKYNSNELFAINLMKYPFMLDSKYQDNLMQPALFFLTDEVLVNKNLFLDSSFLPDNLVDLRNYPIQKVSSMNINNSMLEEVAYIYLNSLFEMALVHHHKLYAYSAFRTYDYQEKVYNYNLTTNPDFADEISARPGHSEHQTGLAIDVTSATVDLKLVEQFGETTEGVWLAENAHKYGFIIRYPKDKTTITGYSYEPWHLRFVGKTVAKTCYENNWTLEEYVLSKYEL